MSIPVRYISDSTPGSGSPIPICDEGESIEEGLERLSELSNFIKFSKVRSEITTRDLPSPGWKSTRVILTPGGLARKFGNESFLSQKAWIGHTRLVCE